MSIESAKALIERMKTDSEFAGKVAACADAETRMTLVKAAGFDFTAQEIGGLRQELTDEDLGGVAGGLFDIEEYMRNLKAQRMFCRQSKVAL